MALQLNFDARQFAPASVDGGSEQFPVSDELGHRVVIVGDESAPTKANKESNGADNSTMLLLHLQIIEGQFAGMKAPYRLNIGNSSEKAREIAYKQLSALCHAIGAFAIGNTQELYNKPFRVVVEQQPGNDKFTQIKGVLTDAGVDPGNPTAGPRQARTAAPAHAPQQHQAPAPQSFAPPPQQAPQPTFAPPPQQAPQTTFAPPPQQQPQQQAPQQQPQQQWTPPPGSPAPTAAPWQGQPAPR